MGRPHACDGPQASRARRTKPHAPPGEAGGACGGNKSLTMTYFHKRTFTIIGAKAFHDPVRDGKAWDHLAMVVKRNRVPHRPSLASRSGPHGQSVEEAPTSM